MEVIFLCSYSDWEEVVGKTGEGMIEEEMKKEDCKRMSINLPKIETMSCFDEMKDRQGKIEHKR